MSNLVKQAEFRARATAYLKNSGIPCPVHEIAKHSGVSVRSAGIMLAYMANQGLIPQPYKEKGKWWYSYGEKEYTRLSAAKQKVVDGDDVMAILGTVMVFKHGHIDESQLIATLKSILKGK